MTPSPSPPEVDQDLLEATCQRLGVRMLVLYGSRASGSPPPTRDSDLDLAVRLAPGAEPDFWAFLEAFGEVFPGEAIDLVFLHRADPLFRWEILREGVLLAGDPIDHLEYRAFAFRDFVDSADLRRLERRLFEKKMDYIRERLRAPA